MQTAPPILTLFRTIYTILQPGKDQNHVLNAMRIGRGTFGLKYAYFSSTTTPLLDKLVYKEGNTIELGGEVKTNVYFLCRCSFVLYITLAMLPTYLLLVLITFIIYFFLCNVGRTGLFKPPPLYRHAYDML